ncbi:MAG: hypothetical protein UH542_04280, partial [Bacteroidales bacterium]|nr:hypothetical protein [Bacteroidales bacterium]
TPLTISNREVKPCIADDTATPSGKVGRRQIKQRASLKSEALFFCACVYETMRLQDNESTK